MQSKPSKNHNELDEFRKLVHDVFVKNERGAKLLGVWKENVMMQEAHNYGKDLYDLGRIEGGKDFVRQIINATKQAEGKQ